MPIAHLGLAIVIAASVFVALVWSPSAGAIIEAAFAALFLAALAVALWTGKRGSEAVRTAYKFAFGWADWISP